MEVVIGGVRYVPAADVVLEEVTARYDDYDGPDYDDDPHTRIRVDDLHFEEHEKCDECGERQEHCQCCWTCETWPCECCGDCGQAPDDCDEHCDDCGEHNDECSCSVE